jgi:hypothetical protein
MHVGENFVRVCDVFGMGGGVDVGLFDGITIRSEQIWDFCLNFRIFEYF